VVGRRLPIVVLTGPAEHLKVQLANALLNTITTSYAVISETALSAAITPPDRLERKLEKFTVDGCLCCVGAVTLLAQLTRLLRAQRREKTYEGLLLIAGPQSKSAALIDQLRQPLLADLVEVSTVVYAATKLIEAQTEEIACADGVFLSTEQTPTPSAESAAWLDELPGNDERTVTNEVTQLLSFGSPSHDTGNKVVWAAERVFDRRSLQTLFDQAAQAGLCFDAVFHTHRAWYRWKVLSREERSFSMLETTYRRQSYLRYFPTEGMQAAFNALKMGIEDND
jgi:hypothetical protein